MNITIISHTSTGIYDIDVIIGNQNCPAACILHGSERIALTFNSISQIWGGYLKASEGDTFEIHAVDGEWSGDYHKVVCEAASGDITTTLEHGVNLQIITVTD